MVILLVSYQLSVLFFVEQKMWNTRPKPFTQGNVVSGPSYDGAQTRSVWSDARRTSEDSSQGFRTGSGTNNDIDESLAFLSNYVSRPHASARAASPAGTASPMPPPSRLAQPKASTNLQQWMASREGSLQQTASYNAAVEYSNAAPHSARSFASDQQRYGGPPPPPALSAPAGALSEPPSSTLRDARKMSPQTIVQQSAVAQQMASQHQHATPMHHSAFPQQPSPAPPSTAPPPGSVSVAPSPPRPSAPQPVFRAGDHDGNLVLMVTYLKNHYGRDADEALKGIESMEPEDVLGLVQCFYIDAYRLIRTLREQSSAGRGRFATSDPRIDVFAPIVDAAPPPPPSAAPPHAMVTSQATEQGLHIQPEVFGQPSQQPLSRSGSHLGPPLERQATQSYLPVQPTPPMGPSAQGSSFAENASFPKFTSQQQSLPSGAMPGSYQTSESAFLQHQRELYEQFVQQQQQQQQQQSQYASQHQRSSSLPKGGVHHARGPSTHRTELSLEQQLRDVPRRVTVAPCPLRAGMPKLRVGSMMLKYCRSGPPHLRYFSVQDRTVMHEGQEALMPHLTWAPSINGSPSGFLSLLRLEEVLIGPVGPNTQRFVKNVYGAVIDQNKKPVDENLCFTLVFSDRTLELCATSEEDYLTWVGTLQSVVLKNQELRSHGAGASKTGEK